MPFWPSPCPVTHRTPDVFASTLFKILFLRFPGPPVTPSLNPGNTVLLQREGGHQEGPSIYLSMHPPLSMHGTPVVYEALHQGVQMGTETEKNEMVLAY